MELVTYVERQRERRETLDMQLQPICSLTEEGFLLHLSRYLNRDLVPQQEKDGYRLILKILGTSHKPAL